MGSCHSFFSKAFISPGHLRVSGFVLILVLLGGNPGAVTASTARPAKVTLLENREYAGALLKGIRNSGKSIVLSCYLFKIRQTSSDMPEKVAEELIKAVSRGVDVTVIFEISDNAADPLNSENRETASFLSRNGIRVLFDSPRKTSHLKAALIDDHYVFVGSHNLTQSALKYNNEVSVLVESPEIAAEMKSYLKRLMTQ